MFGETFTVDGWGRIVNKQVSNEAPVTLTWDGNSRLAALTDPAGTSTYTCDPARS